MRKRTRKQSNLTLVRRILRDVWHHPGNVDHRGRAIGRSIWWQARKRLSSRPRDIPVYGGLKVRGHLDSDSVSNLVYFGDHFDPMEMGFLERYLRPGDGFIDGGANIGTYSLLAASRVGPTGDVVAFEPVADLARRLRENIDLNDLASVITVHEAALSDREGVLRFRADFDVSSRAAVATDPVDAVVEVRCTTLDGALPPGRTYAAAKIDVEGAELRVLQGARSRLEAGDPPVLLIEVLPGQLERLGTSPEQVFGLLDEVGYDIATFSTDREALEWVDPGPDVRGNVLAVARTHRDVVLSRLADSGAVDAAAPGGRDRR